MLHEILPTVFVVAATVVITLLSLFSIFLSVRLAAVKEELEKQTNLARQCMDAKESAEAGFTEAKNFFEEQLKRPHVVNISDDQIQALASALGGKMLPYIRVDKMVAQ